MNLLLNLTSSNTEPALAGEDSIIYMSVPMVHDGKSCKVNLG